MINTAKKLKIIKPILKQTFKLRLKALPSLENIKIFAIPTRIKDSDILAMFKGVISLIREKIQQEQTERFLNLKLKYDRLKYLYDRNKQAN